MTNHYITRKAGAMAVLLLLLQGKAQAQFSAGSSFFITPGTPVFIDSFTLQPAVAGADLSNSTLTVTHTPIPSPGPGAGSIARVYEFSPALNFRGAAGLLYRDSELNGNTAGLLSLVYDNGSGSFTTASFLTTGNANHYVEATTGANTISLKRITAVDAGTVLPVDLLSFTASAEGTRTLIEWATATELQSDRFEIERSADGRSFHFLLSEKAAGNSNIEKRYKAYDEQPLPGWSYYRLKQVDLDGRFVWSPAAAVFFGGHGDAVSVYPNPVQDRLSIAITSMEDRSGPLLLMDALGRTLKSAELQLLKGSNTFSLDMKGLAAGNYLLRIGADFQARIVKRN